MKAAYIESTGPPEVIQYGDLPDPRPQGGQVLVRVGAAAVNPIDTYIRAGAGYFELPRPYIIGCDLAGTVEAVGPGVDRFRVGDRVWGSNQGLLGRQGTFAQRCAVDQQWLYPTPEGVDDPTAAACALVGITAHLGLFAEAALTADETLLVQGGSGGVGAMVIQLARAAGARVIATGGSAEKVARCLELGADHAIDYKREDLLTRVRQIAPEGVDVFWETSRAPDFDAIVSMLAERGRIILMAGRDARPEFPVGPFYVKCCAMRGFVMFKASADEQRRAAEAINDLLAAGALQPNIGKILPLAEAAAAHRLQEENTLANAGTLMGKIVVVMDH